MASIAKFDNRLFSDGTPVQMIKQVTQVRSTAVAKSSSNSASVVSIISTSITTEANSRLFLWFQGHYTQSHAQDNIDMFFKIDGVAVGEWETRHYFYNDTANTGTFRPAVDFPFVSPVLTAGSHTVEVLFSGSQGNATVIFDPYTGYTDRASRLILMEISG
jgi:hypothetical protein